MYLLHILIRYPHRWRLGSCPNGTLQLQGFLHPLHPKKNIEGFWWSLLHPKMFCRSRTDQRLASSQSFCLPACYSVHVFVDCKFIPAFLTTHLVINPAQKARSFGVPKKFSKFCKEVLGLASTSEYLKVANGETIRYRWYQAGSQYWFPRFGGLIQGQICNPVPVPNWFWF